MDDGLFSNLNEYPNFSSDDKKFKNLAHSSSTDIFYESDESKENVNNKRDEDTSFEQNECHCQECEEEEEEDDNLNDIQKRLEDHKLQFQERFKNLNETMIALKKQLSEEKELWRKELEEVQVMQPMQQSNYGATQVAIVEPVVSVTETETYQDTDNNSNTYVCAMSNSEYQSKISEFEEALFKAHADKRAQLKRQISINNYKRRLLEVENMCNLELLRVKQSVQFLQPLQVIASEWNSKSSNKSDDISLVDREGYNSQRERKLVKSSSAVWNTDQDSSELTVSHGWCYPNPDYQGLNSSSHPNLV